MQLRNKLVFLLLYLDSRERHLDFHQTVQWDAVRRHWLVVMPEALCKWCLQARSVAALTCHSSPPVSSTPRCCQQYAFRS